MLCGRSVSFRKALNCEFQSHSQKHLNPRGSFQRNTVVLRGKQYCFSAARCYLPKRKLITAAMQAHGASEDVKGDMVDKGSLANMSVVRFAAFGVMVATAARSIGFLPSQLVGFVHMIAFGTWFGTLAWTSFVFGIVAFRNLPRQTFGKLQAKLFPKYFGLSVLCTSVLLGTLHFGSGGAAPIQEVRLLVIGLVSSLFNMVIGEPIATRIMFERYDLENATQRDEDAISALRKQFGKWHGVTSLLNLVTLVCAVGHAYYLGGSLFSA